jgi:hypothetical protein
MTPEINKHLHAIFDAHSDALQALRIANRTIGIANNAFVEMLAAHDDAIQAAMKANQAALDLLKEMS